MNPLLYESAASILWIVLIVLVILALIKFLLR